jgi:hypothetical protein
MTQQSSPLFNFNPNTTVVGDYTEVAQAQGDIARIQSEVKSKKKPFDFLGVAKAGAEVASVFAKEKNLADAHQAKIETLEFVTGLSSKSGHEQVEILQKRIEELNSGDFSPGYREGSLSVLDYSYGSALKQKEEERVTATVNVVGDNLFTLNDSRIKAGLAPLNPEEWVNINATSYNIPPQAVRDSIATSYFNSGIAIVNQASTPEALEEAIKIVDERTKELKTPMFLDSRSKTFQPVVNDLKNKYVKAIQAKQNEFKEQYKVAVASIIGNTNDIFAGYTANPALPNIQEAFNNAYPDPIAKVKAFNTYVKGYEEFEEARQFLTAHDVDDRRPQAPNNTRLKEELSKRAYQGIKESIHNPQKVIDIIDSNSDVVDGISDKVVKDLFSIDDNEAAKQAYGLLNNIKQYPGGSNALTRLLKDNYKQFVTTSRLADIKTNGDYVKATNLVQEAITRGNKPNISPNNFTDMLKYSKDLGTQAYEYQDIVNTMALVDPSLVDNSFLTKLRDDMKDSIATYTSEETQGMYGFRESIKLNTSKAKVPEALDQDLVTKAIFNMSKEMNYGVVGSEVKFVEGNKGIMYDEYGIPQGVFDFTPVLESINKNVLLEEQNKKREQYIEGGMNTDTAIEAGTTVGATVIDNMRNSMNWFNAVKAKGAAGIIEYIKESLGE